MCGRYTLTARADALAKRFLLEAISGDQLPGPLPPAGSLKPDYNISPGRPVVAIRREDATGRRQAVSFSWGLIPGWTKDLAQARPMNNARSETAAEKPMFRSAMRKRRCLIPADGFYEWKRMPHAKVPHYIRRRDGALFAFAGIWEHWSNEESELETCAVLTTGPNGLMEPIHDRMPVILEDREFDTWLNVEDFAPEDLNELTQPRDWKEMEAYPVSTLVNNVRNNDERLVQRQEAAPPPTQGELF